MRTPAYDEMHLEDAMEDLMEPILFDVPASKEERLNTALEKGYADITAGRKKDAREVFDGIRRDLCL